MVKVLQILTFFLVILAMVPAAAHALELPGKLRLTKDAYIAVQPIYYPGFTIVGMAEPAAIISAIVLLVLMPWGGADFWLTVLALFGLVSMHAVYWLFTHPVNNSWLQSEFGSRWLWLLRMGLGGQAKPSERTSFTGLDPTA